MVYLLQAVSLWFIALLDRTGWLTVLSPLLMTYFLTRRTGKPLLEKHLATSRPGYAS